jgi:hypothetical protein
MLRWLAYGATLFQENPVIAAAIPGVVFPVTAVSAPDNVLQTHFVFL